ncbi:cell division protein [Campylobacter sp. FMV-PI01]|uniref:Probable peptidoglycan glycosyltransferase FtsW n=1 Tax=Campylobacter portucalensis TaxID=2608384 RepID=A0A6L5WJY5_9BACT|nr:FtsW/RodA/SpoVE family cell cycle protein [Campylobacter portucalensis]MSN96742.1 cell division protein [Campylobacter portucalensis]
MRVDKTLFFMSVFLISIGIVFSLSLSAYVVLYLEFENKLRFFYMQLVVGVVGICLMWGISQIRSNLSLTRIGNGIFLISFIGMIILPFVASEINGAVRWFKIAGFSLSPVEFFKVGFIYFLAWSFTRKIDKTPKPFLKELIILVPYSILFLLIIYMIAVFQKDLGQVIVLFGVLFVMMISAGTNWRIWGGGVFFAIFLIYIFIITSDHRIKRFTSWWIGVQDTVLAFLPEDKVGKFYIQSHEAPNQISNSISAISNGGMFGKGIGLGAFKLGFLSEVHTDFVLAGIAEEIGFIGVAFLSFIFLFMIYIIFMIAEKSKSNNVHYLFCIGIGFMFLLSFMINSYGITSIFPVKGLAVPFISYGGSHLLASCLAMGFVLAIYKKN